MKIRVRIENNIVGDSVFWEGDSADIKQIRNVVARILATNVSSDGRLRKSGMWVAEEVKE